MVTLEIEMNQAGQRLDKFLGKYLPEAPVSFFYKMLRKKNITLNGKRGRGEKEKLERLMAEELEQLRMSGSGAMGQEETARLSLMQAELMALLKKYEEAKPFLEACGDIILEQRMEDPQWYCLYEYVSVSVYPDKEKMESLRRLLGQIRGGGQGGLPSVLSLYGV